ncbi:hypothetical protein MEQU1_000597 [Malassezia equina]|uniref:CID domain-containing protein n=1 Tax=Malassezia equina TaxID=1381935 RepID=A0AAF0IYA5_9BASI|nr:hypothetical protein MEQU1_000597 [Malassezia equina]
MGMDGYAYGGGYGYGSGYGMSNYGGGAPAPGQGYGMMPGQDPSMANSAAFEAMFRGHLAHLTFNSKPIITNLTLIAQENAQRMSTVVAKTLDEHILMVGRVSLTLQAAPPHRLPALYLIDSICKNIGSPYPELWSPRIVTLFMESYRVVDQPTRRRMEELWATWRDAGPAGRPLFGENAQQVIERSLFGSQGAPVRSTGPTQAQVVANIERMLALKTQAMAHSPNDTAIQEQIETLRELKERISGTTTSPEVLSDVQKQLDALSRPASTAPPPSSEASAPAPAPGAAGPASASELIANLMKAGLLPSAAPGSTPVGASAPAAAPKAASQDQLYTDYIMSLEVRMTTLDLSRSSAELELLIRDHLPLPCRQCANRYPDGEAGKHGLDDHLDWHFTQNRRARASVTRGQSRAWFDPIPRWIRSGFDDDMHEATKDADAFDLDEPAQERALREKVASSYVSVPLDADVAARPCRICQEKFQSEWSEDVEEWIWRNAVLVDGLYYHASCYYSAKSMSDSVQAVAAAAAASAVPAEPATAHATDVSAAEGTSEAASLKRKASPSPIPEGEPSKKSVSTKQEHEDA